MNDLQISNNGKPRNAHLFQKGQSGNPSGRPKANATITALAREHTEPELQTLVEIMHNKKAPQSARVHAASALLDRAWGKPHQHIESVNMGITYQDWVMSLPPPTEEDLMDIGLTIEDIRDDANLKDL